MKVYLAISMVASKLAKDGISKDRKNVSQGYAFRGIDDVFNALAPHLAEAKLCILPSVLERDVVERTNAKGTALFYVTVKVRFDFVSAEDGSKHEVVTYGEAMDSGDKATNKAMSAAMKYACLQAFCIPTEGDNDADSQTHEVKAKEDDSSGLSPSQVEAYKHAIQDSADPVKLETLWKNIVAACNTVKDVKTYEKLKPLVAARGAALKNGASNEPARH